jgi:hypothetical protein
MAGDINALAGKIEQRGRGQRFSLNCATVRVSYKAARSIWLDIFRRSKRPADHSQIVPEIEPAENTV